jgi:hypothetical protein
VNIEVLFFKIFIKNIKKFKRKNRLKESSLKILLLLSLKLINFLKKLFKIAEEINFGQSKIHCKNRLLRSYLLKIQ